MVLQCEDWEWEEEKEQERSGSISRYQSLFLPDMEIEKSEPEASARVTTKS